MNTRVPRYAPETKLLTYGGGDYTQQNEVAK